MVGQDSTQRARHRFKRLAFILPFPGKSVGDFIDARALPAHDNHAATQINECQPVALLNAVVIPQFLGEGDDPRPDDLYLKCVFHIPLQSANPFVSIAENLEDSSWSCLPERNSNKSARRIGPGTQRVDENRRCSADKIGWKYQTWSTS